MRLPRAIHQVDVVTSFLVEALVIALFTSGCGANSDTSSATLQANAGDRVIGRSPLSYPSG